MCNGSGPNPAIGAERAFGREDRHGREAQTPSVARRIMAAALAGLAIVTVSADRLRGASTTTSTPSSGRSTTTTDPLLSQLRPVSKVNPNQRYPRRAGAKYEDAEVSARGTATLNPIGPSLRVERAVVRPAQALPSGFGPSDLDRYRRLGLVDGYVPVVNQPTGDLLRVVVRVTHGSDDTSLRCIATTTDGSVLVPLSRPRAD
jgi:hypothetical protein